MEYRSRIARKSPTTLPINAPIETAKINYWKDEPEATADAKRQDNENIIHRKPILKTSRGVSYNSEC